MAETVIIVSAVVLRDESGRVLTVRKRGTSRFMLPGGKHEPGEAPDEAAVREVHEELGLQLMTDDVRALGVFTADAANEPGHSVRGHVYEAHGWAPVRVAAAAEIEELRWLDPGQPLPDDLAPLLEHCVLPALEGPWPPRQARGA